MRTNRNRMCLPSQVDPIRKATQSSSSSRSFLTEINILKLAAQHKPSASWGKNSKRKAKMPAEILQSSESEEESSEPGKMVKKKKKKQEKKNKKLIKNKQEKKKNKKNKDTKTKKKKDKKDEIEDPGKVAGKAMKTKVGNKEKEDQDEKKEQTGKRKSFGGFKVPLQDPAKLRFQTMMEVFFETLVPKAATPKADPWKAGLYTCMSCVCMCCCCCCCCCCVGFVQTGRMVQVQYSYSWAKDLETKKAHRKFFRSKARKFLKDKGLE